jgi:hypothetical protein
MPIPTKLSGFAIAVACVLGAIVGVLISIVCFGLPPLVAGMVVVLV